MDKQTVSLQQQRKSFHLKFQSVRRKKMIARCLAIISDRLPEKMYYFPPTAKGIPLSFTRPGGVVLHAQKRAAIAMNDNFIR